MQGTKEMKVILLFIDYNSTLIILLQAVFWKDYFHFLEISIGPGAFRCSQAHFALLCARFSRTYEKLP